MMSTIETGKSCSLQALIRRSCNPCVILCWVEGMHLVLYKTKQLEMDPTAYFHVNIFAGPLHRRPLLVFLRKMLTCFYR